MDIKKASLFKIEAFFYNNFKKEHHEKASNIPYSDCVFAVF